MTTAEQLREAGERKAWSRVAATAALNGWMLWRSDADDGPQRFFLAKWNTLRVCADLDEVERILELVTGRASA